MRISFFLFLFCGNFLLAGNSYSQKAKVTINEKNVSLEKILDEIENQTDYLFIYNKSNVDINRIVSVNTKNKPVGEILDEVFEKTDDVFSMEGTHIILSNRKVSDPTDDRQVQQAAVRISGFVKDQNGEAIPGVSIRVKGTTTGTISDEDGSYAINAPGKDAVVIYSFLGYLTQEYKVGNRTGIDVVLIEDSQLIDEVIVVGYGSTSKRKMVSSISSIPVGDIEALPSSSVVNNLGGRTSGLIVTGQGGGPNNNSTISIRGGGVPKTSTGDGTKGYTQGGGRPLVVVDGVISDYNVFQNMNSSDIESINILKDASAAAVYGARAGNGVVLVTTKKGMNKPLSIKYDFSYSLSQPTVLPKKIGSYDLAMYTNEAYKNDNLQPIYSNEVLEKYRTGSDPYNYPNEDWQAMALSTFAPEYKHNLSINGGDGKNNYYASLSYYNQGSLYTQNTNSVDIYTARLNVTNSFDNIGLKTTTGLSGNFKKFNAPYYNYYSIWGHIQNKSPMDLAYNDLGMYATVTDHPLVEMDPRSGYDNQDWKDMNGMFKAEWMVPYVNGLKLTSLSNYYMTFYRQKKWKDTAPQSPLGSTAPVPKNPPRLDEEYRQGNLFTQQFLVDYSISINDFTLGALGGYEFTKGFDSKLNASRENYQLDVDQFLAGPTDNMKNDGSEGEYGRAGWLGRLKLDYKAKYLLEASFRYDGSDWFPKDKRWGTFYAFSGGWVASDEAFMQELRKQHIIDMLKLRGSYGIVGLDGDLTKDLEDENPFKLKRFSYVPGYNLDGRAYVINNGYVQGFREGDLVSTDITWYTTSSVDLGFDFESLKNSLFGSFGYFYTRTTGYLTSPSSVGYTAPLGKDLPRIKSDGAQRKEGYEVSLGYRNKIGDLHYEVSANYTYYNKLWENNPVEKEDVLKNPLKRDTYQSPFNRLAYKADGYYTSEEDIKNSPRRLGSVNLRPGDIKYADIDGNGIIDDNDKVRVGYGSDPRSIYGINIDLKYKGLYFGALFQGSGKKDFYLGDRVRSQGSIVYPYQENYWTPTNTNALYPRLISTPSYNGSNNYSESDFWIADASYFRLKSLQVGYDLKNKLFKNVGFISTAKVTLSGTNLFTISKALDYYYDPESLGDGNNYNYPYQRVYSLTFNLGF